MFMHDHYKNACDLVLRYKDYSKDPKIRMQTTIMIPFLAEYAPQDFINQYLHKFMVHLQSLLKNPKDRNPAFKATGLVALSVCSAIAPYLDGIILYVREGLSVKASASQFQTLSL